MVGFAYQDPKIGRAFGNLAGVFTGANGLDVVKASVLKAQRENYEAESVSKLAQADMYRHEVGSARGAQDFLATNPDFSVAENRARLAALTLGMRDGLAHGAQANVGAATFAQPGAFNPNDLSAVLLGSGVVRQFGDTPAGFAAAQQNLLDRQRIANDGALAVANVRGEAARDVADTRAEGAVDAAKARGGPLAPVSANTDRQMRTLIQQSLAARAGVEPQNLTVPDATMASILSTAATGYQHSRNMVSAIDDAVEGAPAAERTDWWFLPTAKKAAIPAVSAPGAAPNLAAASVAADQTVQSVGAPAGPGPAADVGQTLHINPKTGQRIVFSGGQWVDATTGAPVK